jgi:hypothetical protein
MFGLVRMVAVTNVKGRHDTDDCGRPPRSPKSAAREIVVIRDELGPCQTEGPKRAVDSVHDAQYRFHRAAHDARLAGHRVASGRTRMSDDPAIGVEGSLA